MSRARDALVAAATLAAARLLRRRDEHRIVPRGDPDLRAESLVLFLLLLSTLCALAFPVLYGLGVEPLTQLLGLSLGLSLAFAAAALMVTAHRLVVTEEVAEPYGAEENPREQEEIAEIVEESGSRITRKRLLGLAGAGAGGALGLALVTPAVSLGPVFRTGPLYGTPWTRGRRLVDEDGRPYLASDIEPSTFYTAFAEGADRETLGASVVVVRLDPSRLRLPAGRRDWAPQGILAYSKICTHAGCAISLYRAPLFQPDEPKPALVCPCHYSTFDPATGGTVIFGPAGRPLPQLPLAIDRRGGLRAAGNFDGPVGPSWWGVRMGKPNP
jgi:ubiquinol-cytochrome c reductase iron-sulfur subunit